MPTVKQYRRGRDTTAYTLRPFNANAAGVPSYGTAIPCVAVLDTEALSLNRILENISAVTSPRANNIPIEDDMSANLTILSVNDGNDPESFFTVAAAYDFVEVTRTVGTGSSAKTYVGHFSWEMVDFGTSGKGGQRNTIALRQLDTGSDTLTRT